jgi:excisionase family DNA binding protein
MRDRRSLQSDSNPGQVPRPDARQLDREAGSTVSRSARMSVDEIARRLDIGRLAVYTMLEQGIIPAIRLGRRWIVTRHAFESWERTCGMPSGLPWETEHKVT